MSPAPVVVVSSLDPVLRDSAIGGLLLDVPGAVVVRHDLDVGAGLLRRLVHDASGTVERGVVELEDECLACTLRDDLLPALRRVACRRPEAVVVALPVGAEPLPVLRSAPLAGPHLAAAGVVVTASAATVEDELLGDALLDEVGLAASPADRRAVGEVLAHALDVADAVLLDGPAQPRTHRLLQHAGPAGLRIADLHAAPVADLLALRRPDDDPRGDLRRPAPSGRPDGDGVWTVDLCSWRPFHPERLLDRLPDLGGGRLRSRGHFWVPTRPGLACGWDGAGGQLSVGTLGDWRPSPGGLASTRLVVTGVDGDPAAVRAAFDASLATDAELARGLDWWSARDDGLDPWLGPDRARA